MYIYRVYTLGPVNYRKCMFPETYNIHVCMEEKYVNSSVRHWTQNKTDNDMSELRFYSLFSIWQVININY